VDVSGLASVRRDGAEILDGDKPIHVEWSEDALTHPSLSLLKMRFRLDAAASWAENPRVNMEALNTAKRLVSEASLLPIASLGSLDSSWSMKLSQQLKLM
jgi:hypothetical protein